MFVHVMIDYQLPIFLQTQYADIAFLKDRPRAPPSMTNPVVYATISGVSREPMYGNTGAHKRQAAGKQLFLYFTHCS